MSETVFKSKYEEILQNDAIYKLNLYDFGNIIDIACNYSNYQKNHVLYFVSNQEGFIDFVFEILLQSSSPNSAFLLEVKKSRFGATSIGNKIYVCGGRNTEGKTTNELEVFNCDLKLWKKLCPMKFARENFGIANLDNFIYISSSNKAIERYDPDTDTWDELKLEKQLSFSFKLFTFDNELCAIGKSKNGWIECHKLIPIPIPNNRGLTSL